MPRIEKRVERPGLSSVLTFTTLRRPRSSSAKRSTSGETYRQGAHQGAQKSTRTGRALAKTTNSKSGSSAWTIQGRSDLQTAQTGAPLEAAATRLLLPQCGQRVRTGSAATVSSH